MSQLGLFKEETQEAVIAEVRPVMAPEVRSACRLPYPGHPRGCPNWGKAGCPPVTPPLRRLIDFDETIYLVALPFDLGSQAAKMRGRHPTWTERQCRNLLYWQGGVKKRLREIAREFADAKGLRVVEVPEAYGVNMTETAAQAGIRLQWPPGERVWKMVLVGLGDKHGENGDS